ncbi:hypothetical protein DBA20_16445 [Pandoraea capi]|nr:hypothetical protein [Pandoraea sp. LA3]MDN4584576.1 hypothetical protein [Pandoraea capi]
MSRKTPHTSCPRGKHVRVLLASGELIYDRFIERPARFVVLKRAGRIFAGSVHSFSIVRADKWQT